MILDRLYRPKPCEILYHYCDEASLKGILASQSIWATAFYALNDSLERKWGYRAFTKGCRTLRPITGNNFIEIVTAIVNKAYSSSLLMVSSFSLDYDSPNQWERYAANGKGYAIGFSACALRMPAKPLRILYDQERQIYEITGNLSHIYEYQKERDFPYEEEFQSHCYHLGLDLCAYKDPAFRDEREIRYAHIAGLVPGEKQTEIIPLGAIGADGSRLSPPCKILYRKRNGAEIPYVALDWSDKGRTEPVRLVSIGPANPESERKVRAYLDSLGLRATRIRRSGIRPG